MRRVRQRIFSALVLGLLWGALRAADAPADLPAVLDWDRRLELSTPLSGVIAEVMVRPGQRVAAGTPLLALDRRLPQARLVRARAQAHEARQRREEVRRELGRTRELFDRTLLSVHDLQLAEVTDTAAAAAYDSARAAVTEAEVALEYSRIVAPFDALVVALPAQAGETVVNRLEARTLAVIAPADRMRARAWVDAAQLAGAAPGDAMTVVIDGESHPGEVALVGLEPEKGKAETPLYRLEVSFAVPEGGGLLRPGHAAAIRVGK